MISLLLIAFMTLLFDQTVKWVMTDQFYFGQTKNILPGYFDLTLVHNTGGAFGLFAEKTIVFIVLSVLTVALLLYFYFRNVKNNRWLVLPFGLVLGGAVGNLIDRVRLGYVVDYLDFYVGAWHWPAFNIADSAICIGLGILVFTIGKVE